MVFQRNIFCAVGTVLSLCHVFGVQGHLIGRMAEPNDLFGRQIVCPDAGSVPCGELGCLPKNRCCNPVGQWSCYPDDVCFTASGTVDCYVATDVAQPKKARSCFDYTQTGCGDNEFGCFQCVSTEAPYCYTEVREGLTNLACDTSPAIVTISPATKTTTTSNTSKPDSSLQTPTGPNTSESSSPPKAPKSTPADPQITPPPKAPPPTAPPPFGNPSSDESGGLSAGVGIGIAVGVVAAVAGVGVLIFLLWKKPRNEPKGEILSDGGQYHGSDYQLAASKAGDRYSPSPVHGNGPAELESGSASLPAELGS